VSNTIPLKNPEEIKSEATGDKIIQISVGLLLAEAIRREHQKESLSELFYPKTYQG